MGKFKLRSREVSFDQSNNRKNRHHFYIPGVVIGPSHMNTHDLEFRITGTHNQEIDLNFDHEHSWLKRDPMASYHAYTSTWNKRFIVIKLKQFTVYYINVLFLV